MALSDPVTTLKGVGEAKAQRLEKLGIRTLEDLITDFPRAYEDRSQLCTIAQLTPGTPCCFIATVISPPRTSYIRQGLNVTRCTLADDTARVGVSWFNQPWIRQRLQVGQRYCFYGALAGDERTRRVLTPQVEPLDAPPQVTRRVIPVYALTKGLSSRALQALIFQALEQESPPDYLPPQLREGLMDAPTAYWEVHRPTSTQALRRARERLVFEEFFLYALGVAMAGARRDALSACPCPKPIPRRFYDQLPFALTRAQRRCLQEISDDLSSGRPMSRLLQGDVGSGKTMVALGAMLQAVENGYQAALMAPTELLAAQHFRTISEFLEPLGLRCALFTGAVTGKKRQALSEEVASGQVQILIGTHALFTDTTTFQNLGLVVIDEQHRFGVRQRAALAAKGRAPHMLVLSATPIPRTLALILYGDLDVSILDELPPGRQTVKTYLVTSGYRARLQGFLRQQVALGHQAYVVCPAVEEDETGALTAAEPTCQRLRGVFPDLRVDLIHGKLRPDAKDQAMARFLAHETDILVATTVIEVGVDVPNATVMIVEDADRFGLSQLHQLRGRVGRNAEQSYCVLISDNQAPDTRKRLKALCQSGDGFAIAQQDLELRGPGDFFGSRQSGLPMFRSASLTEDLSVLRRAKDAADAFLSTHPDPDSPEYAALFRRVADMLGRADDTFN